MKITLSPIASDHTTHVSVDRLLITVDDTTIDLSVIPEGGLAEPDDDSVFVGEVTREKVTIAYHYDSSLAESHQSRDWSDYTFDIISGEVPCPIKWKGANGV